MGAYRAAPAADAAKTYRCTKSSPSTDPAGGPSATLTPTLDDDTGGAFPDLLRELACLRAHLQLAIANRIRTRAKELGLNEDLRSHPWRVLPADLERVGDDGADLLLAAHRRVASG
jgi:hypothetical protein